MGKERETMRDMVHESQIRDEGRERDKNTLQVELAPLAEQMARAGKEGRTPFLVILDGLNMGHHIPLTTAPMLLGRDDDCDVVLTDAGISRHHARLQLIDRGRVEVFDLRSTNGTYINGKRISTGVLKQGDKILFGQRTLAKFVMEDSLDRLYQEELWSSCTRDGLTGISNRSYLRKRLSTAYAFASRQRLPFAVIMFRVFNLKEINRVHGMQTGDQALVQLVRIVSDCIRSEDVFSRYSGNRLVVLSVGLDHFGTQAMAERIVNASSAWRITIPGAAEMEEVPFQVTVGAVSVLPPATVDPNAVITMVEKNLLSADYTLGRSIVAARIETSNT
jgi:diguanylate cyclase (GGDEF)-like protein